MSRYRRLRINARSALECGVKRRFRFLNRSAMRRDRIQSGASRRTPRRLAQRTGVGRRAQLPRLTRFRAPRTLTRVLTEQITSRHNPLIKRAQRIRDGEEPLHLFIEGSRLVDEALRSSTLLEALIYTASFAESEKGEAVLSRVARAHVRGAMVPEPIMRTICDTETPQGVVALGTRPRFELDNLLDNECPLVVALDGLQDPGNVGTIVRATEAAGGSGVVTTPGTAEVYGPKALRASMGSAFRLPVVRRLPLDLVAHEIEKLDGVVVGAAATGAVDYADFNWKRPTMLVIGNEGAGLSSDALSTISETVSIPLVSPVESLNAGIAAAVILFEAARQRGRG